MAEVDATPSAILLGHPIRVVVDGAGLLRWIRATLADDGGQGPAAIVSTVLRVLDGKLTADDGVVTALAADTADCLGVLPRCNRTSLGALYSIVCRDLLPAADTARLGRDIAGRRAYAELFSPGPFGAACSAWSVPPAAPGIDRPSGDVPTLVLRGAADPFSAPLTDLAAANGGGPGVYTLEIPNVAYNVLSVGCVRTIRDAWLDAPAGPPADTSCLARIPSVQLGS